MLMRLRTEPVEAWQFLAQPREEWPAWVNGEPSNFGSELIHERQSGRQVVYSGEWLILCPDGDVVWMTEQEMGAFETVG